MKGHSLEAAVVDYHGRAEARPLDYAFHLIVSDPTPRC